MVTTPESIIINTSDQHDVRPKIDTFFREVYEEICQRDYLEKGEGVHPHFELKTGEIAALGQITDNSITYLLYREAVVALVIQTRTEFNHIRFDFFLRLP